jgi:hypothetical protein
MSSSLEQLMLGAVVMACLTIGLLFIRSWRVTRDRLFLIFGAAFWILAVNWTALALVQDNEARTALYLVRLAAFVLILAAIVDKNRTRV